ncbi:54S ribosomal protein L22, mitochondrial [Orbilia brochopaga]|uniref:54S ribosomal protein L22, mitochondrial n=1 Tax=Orbilia brochopaga TaxID=3140254 RepID=A0AAV9TVK0_9PEZI
MRLRIGCVEAVSPATVQRLGVQLHDSAGSRRLFAITCSAAGGYAAPNFTQHHDFLFHDALQLHLHPHVSSTDTPPNVMRASIRLSSLSRSRPVIPQQCTILPRHPPSITPQRPPASPFQQTRTVFGLFRRKRLENAQGVPLSVSELLAKKPTDEESPTPRITLRRGKLAPSSVFGADGPGSAADEDAAAADAAPGQQSASPILDRATNRIAILKEGGMYPPEASFMRRYRIRMIKRRGRLSRTEKIAREEKEHLSRSHHFKTSIKKLAPLARQIAGKSLSHALVQMRFSPKKASKDILKHLEHARDEAILTKNFDPDKTYISQAWVGRGTPDREPMKRARSRIDVLVRPYTCISVVLKETNTLERLAREKEEKRQRQKVWVPLPNRPIYHQHQYCLW